MDDLAKEDDLAEEDDLKNLAGYHMKTLIFVFPKNWYFPTKEPLKIAKHLHLSRGALKIADKPFTETAPLGKLFDIFPSGWKNWPTGSYIAHSRN